MPIVKLYKTKRSKRHYDLGYVYREEEYSHRITRYNKDVLGKIVVDSTNTRCDVYCFKPLKRGRGHWARETNFMTKSSHLVKVICYNKPGECSDETALHCPFKFECYTTKLPNDARLR